MSFQWDHPPVENRLADGLELLHFEQDLARDVALGVHHAEGGDVDVVVLEVFQFQRFQVGRGEQVVVLVVVHLQLQHLQRDRRPTSFYLVSTYLSVFNLQAAIE